MNATAFRILTGAEFVSEYESSPKQFRAFCSRCGSPLYNRVESHPSTPRVRLGTIDGDPGGRSVANVWTGSKAPWFELVDSLEQFQEGPPLSYVRPG